MGGWELCECRLFLCGGVFVGFLFKRGGFWFGFYGFF